MKSSFLHLRPTRNSARQRERELCFHPTVLTSDRMMTLRARWLLTCLHRSVDRDFYTRGRDVRVPQSALTLPVQRLTGLFVMFDEAQTTAVKVPRASSVFWTCPTGSQAAPVVLAAFWGDVSCLWTQTQLSSLSYVEPLCLVSAFSSPTPSQPLPNVRAAIDDVSVPTAGPRDSLYGWWRGLGCCWC